MIRKRKSSHTTLVIFSIILIFALIVSSYILSKSKSLSTSNQPVNLCQNIDCQNYCFGNVLYYGGTCVNGQCIYLTKFCEYGCVNGQCRLQPISTTTTTTLLQESIKTITFSLSRAEVEGFDHINFSSVLLCEQKPSLRIKVNEQTVYWIELHTLIAYLHLKIDKDILGNPLILNIGNNTLSFLIEGQGSIKFTDTLFTIYFDNLTHTFPLEDFSISSTT
jgi:hypothetical protein